MNTQDTKTQAPLPATSQTPASRSTKLFVKALKWAVFAVVILFTLRELSIRFATVSWSQIHYNPAILILAVLCQILPLFFVGGVYFLLLGPQTHGLSCWIVCAITTLSRLGKYLPGKFASTAGAVWLFHRHGLPISLATRVTLMAQGLMVVMGLITAVPLTLFWRPIYDRLPLAWLWCILLILCGITCLHPKVFRAIENFILPKLGHPLLPQIARKRDYIGPLTILLAFQVIAGLGLWLTIRSVTDFSLAWLPLCISALALAGSLGLLALFAPGGLGVREGILLIILGPVVGPGTSAIVVVLARLISILSELLLASVGFVIVRKARQRRTRP